MAHILTVDDDADIRDMLGMHLRLAGHRCLSAGDASGARFMLAEEAKVDAALVDIMMPGEDGFSLAEALIARRIPRDFSDGQNKGGGPRARADDGRGRLCIKAL